MQKQRPEQLDLELQSREHGKSRAKAGAGGSNVVTLVDAKTASVRQQAFNRVVKAGIFEPPKPRQSK